MRIRPIISKKNSPGIAVGEIIIILMEILDGHFPGKMYNLSTKNSIEVRQDIIRAKDKTNFINHNRIMNGLDPITFDFATLDVVSMFDNIEIHKVLRIIKQLCLHNRNNISLRYELLEKLILIESVDLNIFQNKNKLYKYIKGIPMGGNTSPMYADIYMTYHISRVADRLKNLNLIMIKKYIDDIIIYAPRNNINRIKNILEIALDLQLELNHIPEEPTIYLDMEIYNNENTLETKWYSKDIASNRTLCLNSFIPAHIRRSNHTNRYMKAIQLTSQKHVLLTISKLITMDLQNNYERRVIEENLSALFHMDTSVATKNIIRFILTDDTIKRWNKDNEKFLSTVNKNIDSDNTEEIYNWIKQYIDTHLYPIDFITSTNNYSKPKYKSFLAQYRGEDRNLIIKNIFARNGIKMNIVNFIKGEKIELKKNDNTTYVKRMNHHKQNSIL